MYLGMLSKDAQHLFVELENAMAEVDGDFTDNEKSIIDVHCMEMHVDNNNYICDKAAEDIISELGKVCSDEEKRIIYLEIAATVLADEIYHESERHVMKRLRDEFGLSEEMDQNVFQIISNLKEVYKSCADFVKG